jgi:hypothetical protein
MAITKTVNLDVQSNLDQSTKSVGSLKAQLRQAQAEVAALSDKFGATSQQAVEAAKRASELKDRIGDAKALTDAFNPDAKFNSLSSSLAGVAGGFSAVTGAMGLLGTESKDVELAILKVQSAMAIASGLQQLGESADAFRQMKAVALDAFKSIKAAIGSTGIGLLVVALGTLITYWDEISVAISGANEEQKAYQATQEEVTKSLAKAEENLISVKIALDQAKKGTISKKEALKLYNEKLGEALGKTDSLTVAEQRLAKNTDSYIKSQMAKAQAQIFLAKAAEAAAKAATGEAAELGWWDKAKVAIAQYGSAAAGATTAAELSIKNIANNQKEIALYTNLATKELKKAAEEDAKINAAAINTTYEATKRAAITPAVDKTTKKEEIKLERVEELASLKTHEDEKFKIIEAGLNRKTEALKNDAAAALEIERLKQEGQIALAQKTSEMLGVFSDLLGKQTAEGKALAIAQATINAYLGISEVWKAENIYPEPWGTATKIASTVVIAASAFRTVKDIAAVQVPGGGGGSAGSAPAGGGSAPAAPSFNVVGAGGTNQLAQVMNNKGMPPVQAYVVASNVTSAQSLNRNIVNNATLG